MHAFDRQTDGWTDRQMSIARCDLTKLDAHNDCHQWLSDSSRVRQIRLRLGLCPGPRWGSLQRSPRSLAGLTGVGGNGEWKKEGKGGRRNLLTPSICIFCIRHWFIEFNFATVLGLFKCRWRSPLLPQARRNVSLARVFIQDPCNLSLLSQTTYTARNTTLLQDFRAAVQYSFTKKAPRFLSLYSTRQKGSATRKLCSSWKQCCVGLHCFQSCSMVQLFHLQVAEVGRQNQQNSEYKYC